MTTVRRRIRPIEVAYAGRAAREYEAGREASREIDYSATSEVVPRVTRTYDGTVGGVRATALETLGRHLANDPITAAAMRASPRNTIKGLPYLTQEEKAILTSSHAELMAKLADATQKYKAVASKQSMIPGQQRQFDPIAQLKERQQGRRAGLPSERELFGPQGAWTGGALVGPGGWGRGPISGGGGGGGDPLAGLAGFPGFGGSFDPWSPIGPGNTPSGGHGSARSGAGLGAMSGLAGGPAEPPPGFPPPGVPGADGPVRPDAQLPTSAWRQFHPGEAVSEDKSGSTSQGTGGTQGPDEATARSGRIAFAVVVGMIAGGLIGKDMGWAAVGGVVFGGVQLAREVKWGPFKDAPPRDDPPPGSGLKHGPWARPPDDGTGGPNDPRIRQGAYRMRDLVRPPESRLGSERASSPDYMPGPDDVGPVGPSWRRAQPGYSLGRGGYYIPAPDDAGPVGPSWYNARAEAALGFPGDGYYMPNPEDPGPGTPESRTEAGAELKPILSTALAFAR